jgi:adenylosuccinate synthase
VIVGGQFGDEGKGKVVDYYSSKASIDTVVRFNGGSNAGHTVVVDGVKYALHLLPSGMIYGKPSYIGNGVVVDLWKIEEELRDLAEKKNKKVVDLRKFLRISDRAHLVLPHHKMLDAFQEEIKKKTASAAGTTKRGIGPAYFDKIARFGLRVTDLWDDERLDAHLDFMQEYYAPYEPQVPNLANIKEIKQDLLSFKEIYEDNIVEVGEVLEKQLENGSNVLFEGAQSTLLDIDHGLYPFGTSSTCVAAGGSSGTGVGIQYLNERIGIVKAYVSRVGAGPLMGELDTSQNPGKFIQIKGGEFGTTTGRPRRIAWLDLVAVKYACRVNGLTGIALTKLDILGMLDTFYVICEYRDEEHNIRSTFPARIGDFERLQPVTKEFSGWGNLSSDEWVALMEKGWDVFPQELINFINFIESEVKIPVVILGLGPDRRLTFEKIVLDM